MMRLLGDMSGTGVGKGLMGTVKKYTRKKEETNVFHVNKISTCLGYRFVWNMYEEKNE